MSSDPPFGVAHASATVSPRAKVPVPFAKFNHNLFRAGSRSVPRTLPQLLTASPSTLSWGLSVGRVLILGLSFPFGARGSAKVSGCPARGERFSDTDAKLRVNAVPRVAPK